jgi:hypothetical protein
MIFYRGLNLNQTEIGFIYQNGDMEANKGQWLLKPTLNQHNMSVDDVLDRISVEPNDIKRYDRDSDSLSKVGKYVTACFEGASIYSNDSNEKQKHVVISINANIEDVFIDGRDFLYTIIPVLIRNMELNSTLSNKLALAFGEKIVEYIEKGRQIGNRESNIIFRFVDYICMDKTIIESHYNNDTVLIQGKYSTKFFSAFAVTGGVLPSMIKDIKESKNINRRSPIYMIKENIETIKIGDI